MWKKVVLISSLLVILFVFCIILGNKIVNKNKISIGNDNKKDAEFEIIGDDDLYAETSSLESKISLNTKINVNKIYNKCNHIEKENLVVTEDIINMKEEEAKEYFEAKGYVFKSFNGNEINLEKKDDSICFNHFVIKYGNENDTFLSIYVKDENDELKLYKETDIAREFLTSIDNQTFEEGVEVYGYENVENVLEDYE